MHNFQSQVVRPSQKNTGIKCAASSTKNNSVILTL